MIEHLLAPLHPNEGALTSLFRANIDESMLRDIAGADYGHGEVECFFLLQTIWETGVFATSDYQLLEVLQYTSCAEPDGFDSDPEWAGQRGHWMRLFACANLTRQGSPQSLDHWLVRIVLSAISLGEPVAKAAASLLAWRFLTFPEDLYGDLPLLAFAILLLAVYLERTEDRGPWLKQIAEWVEVEESRARARFKFKSNWLLGLSYRGTHDMTGDLWRDLAKRILASPRAPHLPEADETLRRLAALIAQVDD